MTFTELWNLCIEGRECGLFGRDRQVFNKEKKISPGALRFCHETKRKEFIVSPTVSVNRRFIYIKFPESMMIAYRGCYEMISSKEFMHLKDVSLQYIKKWINNNSLNNVSSLMYHQNDLRRMSIWSILPIKDRKLPWKANQTPLIKSFSIKTLIKVI